MNMTCKIARDLVELYQENIVSRESAESIRAHLKTCSACRKYYREYHEIEKKELMAQPPVPQGGLSGVQADVYAELSRKLRRRHYMRVVGTSAAIGAGSIMLAIGILLTCKGGEMPLIKR